MTRRRRGKASRKNVKERRKRRRRRAPAVLDLSHRVSPHVGASRRQDKRQILFIGHYTDRLFINTSVDKALARCCT